MSDERHLIHRLPRTRPVAPMTGLHPDGRRVVLVKAHPHLLGDAHEILGDPSATPCNGCAAADPEADANRQESPTAELDVRRLAPSQRHEQIFAAFGELATGTAFVLVNDHDPKPLYYQFAAEHPGDFTWDYIESGPATWKVRIGRP